MLMLWLKFFQILIIFVFFWWASEVAEIRVRKISQKSLFCVDFRIVVTVFQAAFSCAVFSSHILIFFFFTFHFGPMNLHISVGFHFCCLLCTLFCLDILFFGS